MDQQGFADVVLAWQLAHKTDRYPEPGELTEWLKEQRDKEEGKS